MELKPFKKLPIEKYFQHDLEKIMMAFRLSDSIRTDLSNIRAAGDEVELAVKDFFADKLYPRYHVCDGHLVDCNLKVSPQYDIIISENSKNPVLFNLADKSQLVYFDSSYCFGEVKRSFYDKKILEAFSTNIARTKKELERKDIAPNFIETSNSGFLVEEPLTNLPKRNPLLTFLFFIDTRACEISDLGNFLNKTDNSCVPNFIVLLDTGILINVDTTAFNNGKIKINLYPEFVSEESMWVLFEIDDEQSVLIYQYMLILEHLNSSIVAPPNLRDYTKNIFDFSLSNFHKI
ncbi:DUF6602 domain-containing protein [Saccharicrinis sp. FJH2]|uniref:DUF6602 domain-containing protein n=1 Tax=Saccharicrinis sp. FJH65 TaxID=3344659 RepID=UPI0035F3E11D